MALGLKNAFEIFGKLLNGPRLAFGGLCTCLAIPFDLRGWALGAIFFGALLAFDLGVVVRRPIKEWRDKTRAATHRIEKRETAIDDLRMEALAELVIVRIRGVRRFQVPGRSPVDAALAKSPLVRSIGPRDFWDRIAEYEVEGWAWEELAEYIDAMAEASPDYFRRFEAMAGRQWLRE